MGKKVGIFFSMVALVLVMTGTAFMSMSVSAAESNAGCPHLDRVYCRTEVNYPNADKSTHRKVTSYVYFCNICKIYFSEVVKDETVFHYVDPATNRCECGFTPQVYPPNGNDAIE